jgi:hypothetical protein
MSQALARFQSRNTLCGEAFTIVAVSSTLTVKEAQLDDAGLSGLELGQRGEWVRLRSWFTMRNLVAI